MSTLIDSNIIIDLMHGTDRWATWSEKALVAASSSGALVINQIVFAETAAYFTDSARFNRMSAGLDLFREDLPWEAAREAGLAHATYRLGGGARERVLADFLIGAHASAKGYKLLTRDARRYRAYFPSVDVIAPDSHP